MKNYTVFQISVFSVDAEEKEEFLMGALDPFHPDTFKSSMMQCEVELAHGRKLIDEKKRKLVIEFEFNSEENLDRRVADVHNALRYRCFNFAFQEPVVSHCEIEPPKRFGDKAKVNVIFTNGSAKTVVEYFDDELSFYPSEFIGLTQNQCSELHTKKDIAYIQS